MCSFVVVFAQTFIAGLAWALSLAILARVILSWVQVPLPASVTRWIFEVTEPILAPVRRVVAGVMGGLDFSPMIVLILIQMIEQVLVGVVFRVYC